MRDRILEIFVGPAFTPDADAPRNAWRESGNANQQNVTTGKQRDKSLIDHLLLAKYHASDVISDSRHALAKSFDLRDKTRRRLGGIRRRSEGFSICHTCLHKRGQQKVDKSTSDSVDEGQLYNLSKTGSSNQGFRGDIDMRIARDGTWFYHGSAIDRKPLVALFASVLLRDEAGDYWLNTPAEKCRIQVEDAPFLAVEMSVTGSGREQSLTFRTNVDENVTAGPEHPIRVVSAPVTKEPAPYIHVRGGLDALIARAVFYDLVEIAIEQEIDGEKQLGVWSGGAFFPLGDSDGG